MLILPGVLLALALGIVGYNIGAKRALRAEVASTPRDPETGVVLGAEAISLGPENASTACLLLHGYAGARSDLRDLGQRLGETGLFVRVARLRGHGTTPMDFRQQTPDTLLEDARAELRRLKDQYDTVYLVGFSMGGAIATLLAAEEQVDRLVLISPYYGVTHFWFYGLPPEMWNQIFSPVIPYVIKTENFVCVNKRESVERMYSYTTIPTRGTNTLIELGRRARAEEVLAAIQCPVLLIHARGDEAASPKAAAKAFEEIGSSDKRIHWYTETSNHHILWDYDGADALERIVEYLSEAPSV